LLSLRFGRSRRTLPLRERRPQITESWLLEFPVINAARLRTVSTR
jgi:hypothetical protein